MSGEHPTYTAPDQKPDKPKEKPKPDPKPKATERPTPAVIGRTSTGSSSSVANVNGHVDHGDGSKTTKSDAVKVGSHACPNLPSQMAASHKPSTLTYEQQLKELQAAAVAVKARYKSGWPRPKCQIPKKELSHNPTDWQEVVETVIDILKDPEGSPVKLVVEKVVIPTKTGTSADLVWVDGPYKEEVELMARVKDLLDAKPASQRNAELHRWIEEKMWEATHKPYIAAPKPL